jgi:hypothetical protein
MIMDKNAFKERAKAHFADRGMQNVDVPEWHGKIFYKTPNLAVLKRVMADSKGDAIEAQARIVVACATDENGEKIWSSPEYQDLMKSVDPGVVARIANAIMANVNLDFSPASMADDEKNSSPIP